MCEGSDDNDESFDYTTAADFCETFMSSVHYNV